MFWCKLCSLRASFNTLLRAVEGSLIFENPQFDFNKGFGCCVGHGWLPPVNIEGTCEFKYVGRILCRSAVDRLNIYIHNIKCL